MPSGVDFPSIAFQSSLSVGAVLFGVFGFLYSVYAMFYAEVDPNNPSTLDLPVIVDKLRLLCRIIAILILINSLLVLYSLIVMNLSEFANIILALGLAFITVITSIISLWMGFISMR